MVTFLAGGTGTPKLLYGSEAVFDPARTPVVCNTGDDVEIGGLLVCPDVDTVLFAAADRLDRETWWGVEGDTTATHDEVHALADAAGLEGGVVGLDEAYHWVMADRPDAYVAELREFLTPGAG